MLEYDRGLATLDWCVLGVFTVECVVKIGAEGAEPWRYFVGPEWRWNNFDFIIVVACMPGISAILGNVSFLRLMRLARIAKIVKKVPQLRMIVMGLIGGLESIGYARARAVSRARVSRPPSAPRPMPERARHLPISIPPPPSTPSRTTRSYIALLVFLVFYLFAILGFIFFRRNDPMHFRSLPVALLTLFRCATLEDWTDVMYINLYGCDRYTGGVYTTARAPGGGFGREDLRLHDAVFRCEHPYPHPIVSPIFWVTFVLVAAFVLFSLFVGSVTMSMSEAMDAMKRENEEKRTRARAAAIAREEAMIAEMAAAEAARKLAAASGEGEGGRGARKSFVGGARTVSFVMRRQHARTSDRGSRDSFDAAADSLNDNDLRRQRDSDDSTSGDDAASARGADAEARDGPEPVANGPISGPRPNPFVEFMSAWRKLRQGKRAKKRRHRTQHVQSLVLSVLTEPAPAPSAAYAAGGEGGEGAATAMTRVPRTDDEDGAEDPLCKGILEEPEPLVGWRGDYAQLAYRCRQLTRHTTFVNFITLVIVFAGVLVGVMTYDDVVAEAGATLTVLDLMVTWIFAIEVALKLVGEAFAPWNFFLNANAGWNTFDFVLVVGGFTPAAGNMIAALKLLRLLRGLKLVKSLPQLAVLVNALLMGFSSIGFIGLIMLLVFYVFAIVALILFRDNDPWHFGQLHIAMLTLFRVSTFEDWTDVMYINIYGCERYGYHDDQMESICGEKYGGKSDYGENPRGSGVLAAFYFIFFVIISGLVLLTLFIGVVTTAMDEAEQRQQEEVEVEQKAAEFAAEHAVSRQALVRLRKAFEVLDEDGGGTLSMQEMQMSLQRIGYGMTDDEMQLFMAKYDTDNSGEIDFAEFLKCMLVVRDSKSSGTGGDAIIGKLAGVVNGPPHEQNTPVKELKPSELTPVKGFLDADEKRGETDDHEDYLEQEIAKLDLEDFEV